MAQTIVNIPIDEKLKRDFDNVCGELGLSMTTAVTMPAKKMAREKRLPFEAALGPLFRQKYGTPEALHFVYRIDGNIVKIVQYGSH